MALLHKVGDRQAVMAETHGDRHDKAHMGVGELVQGPLVGALTPKDREFALLDAVKEGSRHRRFHELPGNPRRLRHCDLLRISVFTRATKERIMRSEFTNVLRERAMDQRIVDLYDEYTHKPLDRRVFMERLVALTGSTAAAQLALAGLASNYALAQTITENDPRISTDRLEIGGLKFYRARPRDVTPEAARAAVIVIHENRGLNPHIEDVTRRVAAAGYLALAPDMLTPLGGTPKDEDAARDMFPKLDLAKSADQLAGVVDQLKKASPPKKVGAVGFCWGGGMVNMLAVAAPGLDAGVVYYGAPPKGDVARINAALMMHYASLDKRINDMVPPYEEALKKAGKPFQSFMYEGVNHAFNNDTGGERYSKTAADLAWGRTLAFFKEKLA